MATIAEIKQAIVNAHNAGKTEDAAKLAEILKQQMAVTPRSQAEVDKEYNAMPWYKQAATAADDLVRIGASGISFGGLDRLLGPEAEKATQEARMRAGWAGVPAEVMGTLASPITRAVGGVGRVVSEALPTGLIPRMLVGAAEGGTLGATDAGIKGKDVQDGILSGAIIGSAIPAALKSISGVSSFIQGTKAGAIDEAFNAGKAGGTTSKSFRQGQAGKPITDAKQEFANAEANWSTANVDPRKLIKEFTDIHKEIVTPSGVSKLTAEDSKAFNNMRQIILRSTRRGNNVQNFDAIRRQLDAWSGEGATEMQQMMATRLRNAIRNSVEEVQPGYVNDLNQYSKAKTAQAAGKELSGFFPKGGLLGHLAQGALVGSGVASVPIVGPGVLAAAPLFSPKTMGLLANLFGEAVGKTGATAGAAAPMWSNYQDSRKRKKEQRKRLEISIPGGDLPVGQ